METLKIQLESLAEHGRIDGEINDYRCDAIADQVVDQTLKITYSVLPFDKEILCSGRITGTLRFTCGRCLETYSAPVDIEFAQSYPAPAESIDLTEEVRDQLVLNLPSQPVCSEACKGLCPQCGVNRNLKECSCTAYDPTATDPRWGKLSHLLKKSHK